MSLAPQFIKRPQPALPGADYAALRAEAIAMVQAMAGDVWTDYNYSDPGVTILEQLCYALTEMPYRSSLPIRQILSPPHREHLELRRQGLFPAWTVLPSNPVTANDLRRLVIDRVPGVANVWFTPSTSGHSTGVQGLYDVEVLLEDGQSAAGHDGHHHRHHDHHHHHHHEHEHHHHHDALIERIRRCYTAHRSLCEDIHKPRILTRIGARVHARLDIGQNADPSDTLADILFALSLYFTPEPRRQSLSDLLAAGAQTSDIFLGPLMLNGFIADSQLTARPRQAAVDEIRQVLASTIGVAAIDTVKLAVDFHSTLYGDGESVAVPDNAIFQLEPLGRDGHPTIHMVRDHKICQPDEARTRHRLAQLWRRQRRQYPLRKDLAARYGAPQSDYRDLASYASVQNQFPAIYGIGKNGLPPGASTSRRAQGRQLTGYLLAFDQLLADHFAQLAFVRQLFSVQAGGRATYATQSIRHEVPGADEVLKEGYEAGLHTITADMDPVDQRRNAVLDLLLSFYGLALQAPKGSRADMDERLAHALIRGKQALLRQGPAITRDRGRGLDYLRPESDRRLSAVERLSRLELGLIRPGTGPETGGRMDGDPEEVEHPGHASFGRRLPHELFPAVERHFQSLNEPDHGRSRWRGRSPMAGHRVSRSLMDRLHDHGNYRMMPLPDMNVLLVVCCDSDGCWCVIGEYKDEAEAHAAVFELIIAAADYHWRTRSDKKIYLVEWLLLRHAHRGKDHDAGQYNFHTTAVIATDSRQGDQENWRRQCDKILRQNMPAHIALDCLYLDHHRMHKFRRLYDAWAEALRKGSRHKLAHSSRRLERFLLKHHPRPDNVDTLASTAELESPAALARPAVGQAPPGAAAPAGTTGQTTKTAAATASPADAPGGDAQATPPPLAPPAGGDKPSLLSRLWSWLCGLILAFLRLFQAAPPVASATGALAAGATGFDTDTALDATSAASFSAHGYGFAIRYLSRTSPSAAGDLTSSETQAILGAGLALMAVQHAPGGDWTPSAQLGQTCGQAAAANAVAAGLPAGICLWLDLEGVAAGTDSSVIGQYCSAWFKAVSAKGYLPGLYVGSDCGLSGDQLAALGCRYFWRSGSQVPDLSAPGYCLQQTIDAANVVDGIAFDLDCVQPDSAGKTPVAALPNPKG
jgi:hypothetical protein